MTSMIKKCSSIATILVLIAILGLPLSFCFPGKTKASENTATASATAKSTIEKFVFVGQPQGLVKANAYVAGQAINLSVDITGNAKNVWASIGTLDPSFPQNLNFVKSENGKWNLKTPQLTSNLNLGRRQIKIFAQNSSGKTIQTQAAVNLVAFSQMTLRAFLISETKATVDWNSTAWADLYLVSWQGGSLSGSKVVKDHQAIFEGLTPGTSYIVSVKALRQEAQGKATAITFKTTGQAPVTVAPKVSSMKSETAKPATKPTALAENKAPQKPAQSVTPQPSQSVSPSPSPSATPVAETKTGSWNKLLVAISILIIAAGAAIGGYYGYEWFVMRGKDDDVPPKPRSNSRW